MYYLENERLKVEISEPCECYDKSRFDWYGFITSVTLDGKHSFCVAESKIPGQGTGGIGLCNEFGIQSPVGYDEAKIGEKFPKIGIGLLEKCEEDYKFFSPYNITPFQSKISIEENSMVFELLPIDCRGYAFSYKKKISLKDNTLRISYSLINTGSKDIRTTEYCHNFVAIDQKEIGPDYLLRFSFPLIPDREQDTLVINNKEISWKEPVTKTFYCKFENFPEENKNYWELIHKPSGTGMRETVNFKLHDFAIWGEPHVVSPEAVIKIAIKPGEKQEWERLYEFFEV